VRDSRSSLLVLRALGLGDGLTAVPALRGLRRAFPGRSLVLAAPAAVGGLLQEFAVVDDVLVTHGLQALPPAAAVPPGRVAVNLHGCGPLSHQRLREAGVGPLIAFRNEEAGHRDGPVWSSQEHEVDRWCRLVRSAGGECTREDLRLLPARTEPRPGRYAVVHPGAASPARRWPPQRWARVVAHLARVGLRPVVTGGPDEVELCAQVAAGSPEAVDLGGRQSLGRLVDTLVDADLLVCGDTGVAHLATALATPSVLLFGPISPELWGPAVDEHLHRVIWPGRPGQRGDPHADTVDPLLARITVDEVVAEIDRLAARTGGSPAGRLS
jgi:ADP-heptose:LPS heptosyltransferase